jgi:hypothetical protein
MRGGRDSEGASSSTSSLVHSFRVTIHSIQEWAKDPVMDNGSIAPCGTEEQSEPPAKAVVFGRNSSLLDQSTSAHPNRQGREDTTQENNNSFFTKAFIGCLSVPEALGKVVQGNVEGARERISVSCKGDLPYEDLSASPSDDDMEQMQMHRLTSWGTFGTIGTAATTGTNMSSESIPESRKGSQIDDQGFPIDPKLIERSIKAREKRSKRHRVVKFEYPPITSLKQCPRYDPDGTSRLFFSEEELDMYEDDRRSTFTVVDVEIVAISTSLSDEEEPVITPPIVVGLL